MRKLQRILPWLFIAVFLLSACQTNGETQAVGAQTATVAPILQGIPLYGDAAEAQICGNVLQLTLWQSGPEAVHRGTFLFDLKSGEQTGELTLSENAWSVGALENGMYTVSLTDGKVTLYNTACQWQLAWNLQTPLAFAQVSPDGEWLLYGDAVNAAVRLRRLKTGEERKVASFSGYVDAAGMRDNAFYLTCGAEELLRIDPQKDFAEALVVDKTLHKFTPYYCVGTDEAQWRAVSADHPAQVLSLAAEGENEELLAAGESGWLTAEKADSGTTVRLYRPYAENNVYATVPGSLLRAVCTADGALLITTDGETVTVSRLKPNDDVLPTDTSTHTGVRFLLEDVPVIPQNPLFPTGCESVSAVMALQYAGEDITTDTFIDRYLPTAESALRKEDGRYYGPDPYEVFVGDPRTEASYGCMAPVIERAIDTYFGTDTRTVNTTGQSLEMLCEQYVAEGIPVLTWVTVAMREVEKRTSWYTPDGELFTWPGNEHCMVLIGYDAEKYYFNDPYLGMRVAYDRTLAENRYYALGRQSLAIVDEN